MAEGRELGDTLNTSGPTVFEAIRASKAVQAPSVRLSSSLRSRIVV